MLRTLIVCAALLAPAVGMACESTDQRACKKLLTELVRYRSEAMANAFGDLHTTLPEVIQVKFVTSKDPEFGVFGGRVAYDGERRTLLIPRRYFAAKLPNPLRSALYYWPFYENEQYREAFPLIEAIDNALWGAYMQEAARVRGLSWPHAECVSVDVSKRLPCEMLVEGVAEHLTTQRTQIFNSNRLDRIWPEDFSGFRKRVWVNDPEYVEVQRYGGMMLVRPLVSEFGVRATLIYVAQTPFRIEGDDLRQSARLYQDRARAALNLTHVDVSQTASAPREKAWPASGFSTVALGERVKAN